MKVINGGELTAEQKAEMSRANPVMPKPAGDAETLGIWFCQYRKSR